MLVGIGLDQAGVHRKAHTIDKATRNASFDNTFEHMAKNIVLAEPLVAYTREHRVIWHLVLNAKPTEPTIGKVDLDFAAQRPLRADRKHVANDEHPDHQNRIDRWSSSVGIVWR